MSFLPILRTPDRVIVQTDDGFLHLQPGRDGWKSGDIVVSTSVDETLHVSLHAPQTAVQRIHLRWQGEIAPGALFLGDDWERGYGTLAWRTCVPERAMPWYLLVTEGAATHGYGVKTGPAAFAFWRADETGISLWLDVRCGGMGVLLGERTLPVAEVTARQGQEGDTPFQAARAFCRQLCDAPRLPDHPVYGSNNWYYAYGNSSHAQILRDTELLVAHAPDDPNRPYMVIDAGWQPRAVRDDVVVDSCSGGPWDHGNMRFPDMPGLAAAMRELGARPGIWARPLGAPPDTDPRLLMPATRSHGAKDDAPSFDPSYPENLQRIEDDMRRFTQWGFTLIKHDFTTYDLLGNWGWAMGVAITNDGWHFADRTHTTAEHILAVNRAIRRGAGETVVIACNAVSHLSAGIFEIQRTGDDTSGLYWERTRKMGINTLAFRMPQHEAFYLADADCVGLTTEVDWAYNAQWLDLLARSATPLFVSPNPAALGPQQAAALRAAFARAAHPQLIAEPLDWQHTTCPRQWRFGEDTVTYTWVGPDGVEAAGGGYSMDVV